MKKKKRIIFILLFISTILIIGLLIFFNIFNNKLRLTVYEEKWINDNANSVISVNVINDLNIFAKDGTGVYYDFLNDIKEKYNLNINPITHDSSEEVTGATFGYSLTSNKENTFYEDNFVLVSKKDEIINDLSIVTNKKIGVTNEFKEYLTSYMTDSNNELVGYNSKDELLKDYNESNNCDYILVPQMLYIDEILKNNYHTVYHISDANIYYTYISDDSVLSNIILKYLQNWKKENFYDYFNASEFNLFTSSLNILSKDVDTLRANSYKYGFINNSPYEIISGGSYGGINATYLKSFADFAGIKFDFVKFNSFSKFENALINNKIDLYYDYYDTSSNYESISSNLIIKYYILAREDNDIVIKNLASIKNEEIYIENNSKLLTLLKQNQDLNLVTYKNDKELKNAIKNNKIIVLDYNKYESLKDNLLGDYSIRYSQDFANTYSFRVNSNSTLTKLMTKYFESLDNEKMHFIGISNYIETRKNGSIVGALAKYILILLTIFAVVIIIAYRKGKKIKIAKKIKKEDKMRFIDQLTSLKNRNYLNENLENWNKNTIYPQAVIVLDLNKLQDINDTLGYEQGDIQIQAAANILIKTQLDNSDIIRTDGNEFLIYLVGYEVKQITAYIHKLNKEFKKLPFDYGVAIGYSMITDDVKSIEDATNEAVEQVKNQKEDKKED